MFHRVPITYRIFSCLLWTIPLLLNLLICRTRIEQQKSNTGSLTSTQNAAPLDQSEICSKQHELYTRLPGETYCNATFDGYLCWPPTLAGHNFEQHCPSMRLSDPSQFAYRRCGYDGRWLGRYDNEYSLNGWTNYTSCFPAVVRSLFFKVYEEVETAQRKFHVAGATRAIEIVGFSLSFVLLTISIFILNSYPTLNNLRTLIHKNLFLSMNAQVIVRLIVYIDQALMRWNADDPNTPGISAIEKIPQLCIAMYVILENLNTSMFIWMLNEGIYLNSLVTSNVMRDKSWYKYFWIGGWIFPLIITSIWVIVSAYDFTHDDYERCWYGYNFRAYYWVMQGPRFAVIVINFGFLGNIIRVLVMKLRQDNSSEVVMVRKAVKATAVLLPLLGITNILSMFEGPVDGPVWAFASHSYITHFARSFQGTFLAILYCFLNGEVNALLAKSMANRVTILRHRYPMLTRILRWRPGRREPEVSAGYNRPALRPGDVPLRANPLWVPRSQMPANDSYAANVSETEFGGPNAECRRNSPVAHCSQSRTPIETPRGRAPLHYLRRRSNSPSAHCSQSAVPTDTPRGMAAMQYLPRRRSNSPVAHSSQTTTASIEIPRGRAALQYLPRRSNSPVAHSSQTTASTEIPRGRAALQYLPSPDI